MFGKYIKEYDEVWSAYFGNKFNSFNDFARNNVSVTFLSKGNIYICLVIEHVEVRSISDSFILV